MCITLDWWFPPTFHVLHAEIKFNWVTHIYRGLSWRFQNTTTKKRPDCLLNTNIYFERASENWWWPKRIPTRSDPPCHWDLSLEHRIKRSPHSACLSNSFHQLAITKDALEDGDCDAFGSSLDGHKSNRRIHLETILTSCAGCLWHFNESDMTWHNNSKLKRNTRDKKYHIDTVYQSFLFLPAAAVNTQTLQNFPQARGFMTSIEFNASCQPAVHH